MHKSRTQTAAINRLSMVASTRSSLRPMARDDWYRYAFRVQHCSLISPITHPIRIMQNNNLGGRKDQKLLNWFDIKCFVVEGFVVKTKIKLFCRNKVWVFLLGPLFTGYTPSSQKRSCWRYRRWRYCRFLFWRRHVVWKACPRLKLNFNYVWAQIYVSKAVLVIAQRSGKLITGKCLAYTKLLWEIRTKWEPSTLKKNVGAIFQVFLEAINV